MDLFQKHHNAPCLRGQCIGPFTVRCNCVVLLHCTLLRRNCDVTALQRRKSLNSFKLEMWWCCGDLRQKVIGISAPQRNASMNGPLLSYWFCNLKSTCILASNQDALWDTCKSAWNNTILDTILCDYYGIWYLIALVT